MAQSYYPQQNRLPRTLTAGQLIELLKKVDPAKPVIFRSPQYGAFGSNHAYSVEEVRERSFPARSEHHPASSYIDDETGVEVQVEAWVREFHAWDGIEIA